MELQNVEMIPFVTRHYHWLVKPLLYMYGKYFDVPFTFFSDRPINGYNVIEAFPRDMYIYKKPCGSLIKDALRQIDKPIVAIILVDEFPIHSVDMDKFQLLVQYMIDDTRVARGNLSTSPQWHIQHCNDVLCTYPELSIVKIPSDHPHIGQIGSSSLNSPSLWRRDFLLEFIQDDWQFDNIEVPGCNIFAEQNKWYSIGTISAIVDVCALCYTRDPTEVWLSHIPCAEDREYISRFVPEGFKIL